MAISPTRTRIRSLALMALGGGALSLALAIGSGCATRPVPMMRAHGNQAFDEGRYADAAAFLSQVVDLSPGRAEYRYEYGRALRANGQLGAAAEQLAIAHGLDPASEKIVSEYAEILIELNRIDTLEEVLVNRAQTSAAYQDYLLLGKFLGEAGDPDGEEQALLSAADLAGRLDDSPQRALARFYEQTNQPEQAVQRWKMVLWFNPTDPEASYALRQAGEVPGPTASLIPQGRIED